MNIRSRVAALLLCALTIGCGGAENGAARNRPAANKHSTAWIQTSLAEAWRNINSGQFPVAEQLARRVIEVEPESSEARLVLGYACENMQRIGEAVAAYEQIPDDGSEHALKGQCLLAQLLFFEKGRAADAERLYRDVLDIEPNHELALQGLAKLLDTEGRYWESLPYRMALLRLERFDVPSLLALGWVQVPPADVKLLELCRTAVPDDPLPLLGLARAALRENDRGRAERYLNELLRSVPTQLDAQALLAELMLTSPNSPDARFREWNARLPENADSHPDIWFVRGLWASEFGSQREAARCFWECLTRNPDHPHANHHLGRCLAWLENEDVARPFLECAQQIEDLGRVFALIQDNPAQPELVSGRALAPGGRSALTQDNPTGLELFLQAAETLQALGRHWEAWAWQRLALSGTAQRQQAQRGGSGLFPKRDRVLTVRTDPSTNPALVEIDLSDYPLPRLDVISSPSPARGDEGPPVASAIPLTSPSPARGDDPPSCRVTFRDATTDAGVTFQYFNGHGSNTEGLRMFEYTGGGVAVIDYDGDAWPDLYFSQGCEWPPTERQVDHLDRLFRNLGDGQFADVTQAAALIEDRFGQGVTAGDYDQDGFSDLYVANVGRNRLFRNNGDGTFADVTLSAGISGEQWTTSCAMADLNGDSFPDIYDVNYLSGADVYTRKCGQTRPRVCNPVRFPAEQDRLYLNLADGSFRDVTEPAGITADNGKGLGIVVASFGLSPGLGLFVANDGVPNHFFVYDSVYDATATELRPRFVERGLTAGLAFDADGRSQACMGVAAGDADNDALLDLFVTNFYNESNTLYRQDAAGLFTDSTRAAGLREPSFHLLGFGTQFLDADLDGLSDLVIANGDIDDFRHEGRQFHQPPQFLQNLGGRFREIPSSQLGSYFQGEYLGRGLTRLDWNRDGLEEFVVTHLDSPVALLANATPQHGHYLALRLCGVESSRDPIGATVTVTTDRGTVTRHLTAGDGYMAANERKLIFGLGDCDAVRQIHVRWPSGRLQIFGEASANQELVVVEGSNTLIPLPRG